MQASNVPLLRASIWQLLNSAILWAQTALTRAESLILSHVLSHSLKPTNAVKLVEKKVKKHNKKDGSIKVISLRHHPALFIGQKASSTWSKVKSPVSIPRSSSFFLIIFTYAKLFLSKDTKMKLKLLIFSFLWKNYDCNDDSEALNRRQSLDYFFNPPSIYFLLFPKKIKTHKLQIYLSKKRTKIPPYALQCLFSPNKFTNTTSVKHRLYINQYIPVSEISEWEIP